jgi:MFS family permease
MLQKILFSIKRFFKHPLFLSFYLPSLLTSIALGLRNTILPLYTGQLSDNYGLIGLVVAGAGLGTLIADLPTGRYVQRIDKRSSMIAGLGLVAVSNLFLVWVHSVWLAMFLQFISGIANSVYLISMHSYITNAARKEIRGRAISLFGGVLRVGLFLGPVIGGQIATAFGLRLPFVAYFLFVLAAILVLIFAKGKFIAIDPEMDSEDNGVTSFREALKGRFCIFIFAGLGYFLAMTIRAGQSLILPLWGADVLGLSPDKIGWAVGLSAAISMTLFYPVGLIMDRIGRKAAIVASFLLLGTGLALLPLVKSYGVFLLVAALIGFGHGMGSGAMMTVGSDLSPKKGRSVFLGAWRLIGDTGNSGGPLIVGFVANVLALPSAALVIALPGFLAGAVFIFLVPETLKKKLKPTVKE